MIFIDVSFVHLLNFISADDDCNAASTFHPFKIVLQFPGVSLNDSGSAIHREVINSVREFVIV